MIEVKSYGPALEELHRQFAVKHWTKRKRINPEYIYWKFRGSPGQDLPGFILALDLGRVVGQLGLVPCIIEIDGRKVEAQWACDLMVDQDYRGKGIANMLYERAFSMKPLTLGSDASPAATISMKRAGFISLRGPWKFLFPFWLGEIVKLKGYHSSILNRIRNPFIYLLLAWRFLRNRKPGFHTVDFEAYTEVLNNAYQKNLKVLHDGAFANWRYSVFNGFYNGVQLYVNKGGSFFSLYADRDVYMVTEWGARNMTGLLDILSEIVMKAYHEGVLRIRIMSNTAAETNALMMSGFIKFRTRTDIIFYTKEKELGDLLRNKYFYYTYLDSDENI